MDKRVLIALCIWLAFFASMSILTLTSYSFFTNNSNYVSIMDDPDFMEKLPDQLSREVADEISVILSLSPDSAQRVYDALLRSTDEEWARVEGEKVINDLVDYLTGKKDALESNIDISQQKSPLIQALLPFIPALLIEAIQDLLPSEVPLVALVNMNNVDNTKDIFSYIENLRYLMLFVFVFSCISISIIFKKKMILQPLAFISSLATILLGFISICLLAFRIEGSLKSLELSFIDSFAKILTDDYILYALPYLLIPALITLVTIILSKRDKRSLLNLGNI